MPPNIFPGEEKLAAQIEKRAGMQAAGAVKGRLRRAQFRRQLPQNIRPRRQARISIGAKLLSGRCDRGFAANPATRRG